MGKVMAAVREIRRGRNREEIRTQRRVANLRLKGPCSFWGKAQRTEHPASSLLLESGPMEPCEKPSQLCHSRCPFTT
jgi:hypothetical protein